MDMSFSFYVQFISTQISEVPCCKSTALVCLFDIFLQQFLYTVLVLEWHLVAFVNEHRFLLVTCLK